jgi:hypothetical protein
MKLFFSFVGEQSGAECSLLSSTRKSEDGEIVSGRRLPRSQLRRLSPAAFDSSGFNILIDSEYRESASI